MIRSTKERGRSKGHGGDLAGVVTGGSLNLVGNAVSQVLRFAMVVVLARLLDTAQVGLYFQAFAFLAILGLLSLSGFQSALTRFVAVFRVDGDSASLRGTLRLGLGIPTLSAIALGALLFVLSSRLADQVFHDPRLASPLRFVAVALPATVLTDAALSATRGFKTMRPYALVGLIFEPASRLLLTWVLVALGFGLSGAMSGLVATNVAAAFLAVLAIRRLAAPSNSTPRYRWRLLFSFSTVSWVSTLASTGLLWADTLLLGIYGSASDVALYQVATRLTLLVMIFMHSLNASFAPRIADLYRSGQRESLGALYALVTSWIVRLSLPAFVLIMVFPQQLLSMFGDEFTAGASITVLLAVGTLFDVLSGPCGHMLVMSGRPALTMANNLCGLALNIGLNIWLIPRFGLTGAGIAWAASLALINVARLAQVWFTMRMLPFNRGLVKGLIAAAAAAIVALIVQRAGGSGLSTLAVGALAIGVVYGGLIFLLGVDSDDRLVLRTLWRRLTGAGAAESA